MSTAEIDTPLADPLASIVTVLSAHRFTQPGGLAVRREVGQALRAAGHCVRSDVSLTNRTVAPYLVDDRFAITTTTSTTPAAVADHVSRLAANDSIVAVVVGATQLAMRVTGPHRCPIATVWLDVVPDNAFVDLFEKAWSS